MVVVREAALRGAWEGACRFRRQPGHRTDPRVGEGERLRGQRPWPRSGFHSRGLREGQRLSRGPWPSRGLRVGRRLGARASKPDPVALRRHRVHEAYEIGGAPIAPHGRQSRQRGFHLAPRLGGRNQTAAPCGPDSPGPSVPAPASSVVSGPSGTPGGSGASMLPPAPIAVRSSARAPHSSQSSSPGSSSALPAATSNHIRAPYRAGHFPRRAAGSSRRAAGSSRGADRLLCSATGEAGPRCRRALTPASAGMSRTSKRRPVASRNGEPGTAAQPSSFSYHCRTGSLGWSGRRGRGQWEACQEQPSEGLQSYAGCFIMCAEYRNKEPVRAIDGARVFAHSGGNRCARHGVSVRTGKTSLVGGATRMAQASHVRHRRTAGEGICLACGNIVSHHQVGQDVGVRGQEAKDGVGSWNERSPLAGLSCGRTGRGASPYCLTALRSD